MRTVALALGLLVVVATGLSLLRAKAWWVRVWDFPRTQVAAIGIVALLLGVPAWWTDGIWQAAGGLLLLAAVLFQLARVWRYTRLAPREVQRAHDHDPARSLSLVVSNVLQTNRAAARLLGVVREANADVVLCVETDAWWRDRLDALCATHPHAVRCALPNTYGMLLYSRLPLHDVQVDYLVQPDIPSIQARVQLPSGDRVWLNCVHPRPPAPGESDESLARDAELLLVGRRVCDAEEPVIVFGDLNDVAWSRSTRLFQKVSRLVDPRKGRGLYSTFHARWPFLRWPLDHVFFSDCFRFVDLRRLPNVGSDHFPVYVALSYEPSAAAEQEAPDVDGEDVAEAHETIAEGRAEQ